MLAVDWMTLEKLESVSILNRIERDTVCGFWIEAEK